MSLAIIRAALEKRLAAQSPTIATAFENVVFSATTGVPYQRVNLLPATPDNSIMGAASYFEQGIFQVTLCYPIGTGPADCEAQVQLLRTWFKRATTMLEQGITVMVTDTPAVGGAAMVDDRFCVPVSISYRAQVLTP